MARLGFSFQLQLSFSEPVRKHAFVLRCLPRSNSRQQVLSAALHVMPSCEIMHSQDLFGLKQSGTVTAPHAGFSVQATGSVIVSNTPELPGEGDASLPWQLGPYRIATPLTTPGKHLTALEETLPTRNVPQAVMALLGERFTYLPGSTHAATTAEEAAATMQGVCQDEAHIMLSLLRMRRIPCRYVMGYMLGEGSTHAWVEVLENGRWIGLDPTNHRAVNDEYIRVAAGRDANDCPVNRGIFSGTAMQQSQSCLSVWHMNE